MNSHHLQRKAKCPVFVRRRRVSSLSSYAMSHKEDFGKGPGPTPHKYTRNVVLTSILGSRLTELHPLHVDSATRGKAWQSWSPLQEAGHLETFLIRNVERIQRLRGVVLDVLIVALLSAALALILLVQAVADELLPLLSHGRGAEGLTSVALDELDNLAPGDVALEVGAAGNGAA